MKTQFSNTKLNFLLFSLRLCSRLLSIALLLVRSSRIVYSGRERVLAPLPDPRAEVVESEGNGAARQGEEGEKAGGPLVAEAVVHVGREEDAGGAPEGTDEGLGGEGGGRLVLVAVDEVVVGRVVEEDEAEADGEASEAGADPDEARVRGPGEDEQADRDAPARDHHGNKAHLGGRVSVVLLDHLEVVSVYKGRAGGRGDSL